MGERRNAIYRLCEIRPVRKVPRLVSRERVLNQVYFGVNTDIEVPLCTSRRVDRNADRSCFALGVTLRLSGYPSAVEGLPGKLLCDLVVCGTVEAWINGE